MHKQQNNVISKGGLENQKSSRKDVTFNLIQGIYKRQNAFNLKKIYSWTSTQLYTWSGFLLPSTWYKE